MCGLLEDTEGGKLFSAGRAMRQVSPCLIVTITTVPPAARRAKHFPRASAVSRVPASALAPGDVRFVHLWQHRFFPHAALCASPFDGLEGDHVIAEFRLPGLLDADRTEMFSRHGQPGTPPGGYPQTK